jgi:hypothetical protein
MVNPQSFKQKLPSEQRRIFDKLSRSEKSDLCDKLRSNKLCQQRRNRNIRNIIIGSIIGISLLLVLILFPFDLFLKSDDLNDVVDADDNPITLDFEFVDIVSVQKVRTSTEDRFIFTVQDLEVPLFALFNTIKINLTNGRNEELIIIVSFDVDEPQSIITPEPLVDETVLDSDIPEISIINVSVETNLEANQYIVVTSKLPTLGNRQIIDWEFSIFGFVGNRIFIDVLKKE